MSILNKSLLTGLMLLGITGMKAQLPDTIKVPVSTDTISLPTSGESLLSQLTSDSIVKPAPAQKPTLNLRPMPGVIDISTVDFKPLPNYFFTPAVYSRYPLRDTTSVLTPRKSLPAQFRWLQDQLELEARIDSMRYYLYKNHPWLVKYNMTTLPEPPKQFHALVNPEDHSITIVEVSSAPTNEAKIEKVAIKKRHWIKMYYSGLQFSQAYVSPNWYQGGNNNLNGTLQLQYDVSLNQTFHPKLLFDTSFRYKLGANSAPEDSIHNYNITEDLLQFNTTFGVKAVKNWYYSFTGQLKTQLLNNYAPNSRKRRSSFMSPGEITAGVGMTYNKVNKPKTFTLDLSIAPISYNLKTCIDKELNVTAFGIEEGKRTISKFGSTFEMKMKWKMTRNIALYTRLFAFTNYKSAQADWENTLEFTFNRYISSQVYTHLRYDTETNYDSTTKWKKLQLKEIFSIGFSYRFETIKK